MPQIKKSLISQRRNSIFFPDIPSPSFSISMNQTGDLHRRKPKCDRARLNAGYEPLAVLIEENRPTT